jgi:hypothetical protein
MTSRLRLDSEIKELSARQLSTSLPVNTTACDPFGDPPCRGVGAIVCHGSPRTLRGPRRKRPDWRTPPSQWHSAARGFTPSARHRIGYKHADMAGRTPITRRWQPCPHCSAHGWITRKVVVTGSDIIHVWVCENCQSECTVVEPDRRTGSTDRRHGSRTDRRNRGKK